MGEGFLKDPAIDRWASMRENVGEYFKWNPRTVRAAIVWGVIVPVAIYEIGVAEYRRRDREAGKPSRYPSIFGN